MGRNTQLMRGKVSALAKPATNPPAQTPAPTGGSAGADPLPHNMMRENSEKPKPGQPAKIKRLPARLTPRTCARILTGKPAVINDSTIVVDRDGTGKQGR